MPVVINKSTGRAEDIAHDKLSEALQSDMYEVPLVDQNGDTVSVPYGELKPALQSKQYRQPLPEELNNLMTYAQNATPIKQVKTAALAALEGATMGASSVILDKTNLVPAEEQRALKQTNPGVHDSFKTAGLIGSVVAAPEAGIAKAFQVAGRAGEGLAALAGATEATRLGRLAIAGGREAAEAALYQAGDEMTKQFVYEPEKSVAHSIADVGLAATVGAGWGVGLQGGKFAVNKLFKATKELPLVQRLAAVKAKLDEGRFEDDVADVAQKAGIELTPEMTARLSKDPLLRKMSTELGEKADTAASREMQTSIKEFKDKFNDAVLGAIGKTKEDVGKVISSHDAGKSMKEAAYNTLRERYDAAKSQFEPIKKITENQVFPNASIAEFKQELTAIAQERGWYDRKFTGKLRALNDIVKDVEKTVTFEDFGRKLGGAITDLSQKEMYDVAKVLRQLRNKYEDNAERYVMESMFTARKVPAVEAQALRAQQKAARAAYHEVMDDIRTLAERVKLVKYSDEGEKFFRALKKKDNVKIASNLSADVPEMYEFLSNRLPGVANELKKYKLADIPLKADESGTLKPKSVLDAIAKMSPEERAFALSPEVQEKLTALSDLSARLGKTKEIRSVENAMRYVPGGAAGLMSYMLTGNLATAGLFFAAAQAGRKAFVEAPDSLKMSLLKAMASDKPISGSGFKAMFDMTTAMSNGAKKQAKAISSIFKPGRTIIETSMAPTAKSLGILDKVVVASQANPSQMQGVSDDLGHYAPDHSTHLTMTSARAMSYLASVRPKTAPVNPLDMPVKPSEVEIARYNRALEIAEQPLTILKHVKDGTITPQDIEAISNIYPSLYEDMKQKTLEQLMELRAKGTEIDYKTRIGLSVFLGQPLESSMMPQNIMANQVVSKATEAVSKAKPSSMKVSKIPNLSATPEQLREQKRSK